MTSSPLGEIALTFLRLGITAFGGPAAHIAMMENEFVRRRGWLTHERFLDLLGAANLIPGPSSTELAIYIGFEQAGALGLIAAGTCFILPAALMVGAIAWAYVRFGSLPALAGILYGIKPVVIAVVVQALWGLAPKAVKKSSLLAAVGVAACAATALGVDALAVLVVGGIATVLARRAVRENASPFFFASLGAAGSVAAGSAAPASVLGLFLTFVKIGALVFGSGYVLLAFLRAELVDKLHWLSEPQLLDAVAVGQVTPGPVFTTATFIGYLIAGPKGAAVATLGIFLPGLRARRAHASAPRSRSQIAERRELPRRRQRRIGGPHDRRHGAARARRDRGRRHREHRHRFCGFARAAENQFDVARCGRSDRGHPRPRNAVIEEPVTIRISACRFCARPIVVVETGDPR